jgi:hypothetical protein
MLALVAVVMVRTRAVRFLAECHGVLLGVVRLRTDDVNQSLLFHVASLNQLQTALLSGIHGNLAGWIIYLHSHCTEDNCTVNTSSLDLSNFFRYTVSMKTQQKRPGRPKKSSDQLQTEYLDVRLIASEKEAFKAAADLAGMPVSAWVRDRLRRNAKEELREAGQSVPFLNSKTA